MNTNLHAAPEGPESPLQEADIALTCAVSSLFSTVANFEARLDRVLRPVPPETPSKGSVSAVEPVRSQHVASLVDMREQIEAAVRTLYSLMDRLDV